MRSAFDNGIEVLTLAVWPAPIGAGQTVRVVRAHSSPAIVVGLHLRRVDRGVPV